MKWLRRIVGLIGAVFGLLVIVLIGFIVIDAAFGDSATNYTNITYPGDEGETLHGYLARPETPGPHPAILLIHEWWGLNAGMTVLAEALAAEGYVVLAADAMQGRLTSNVPRALYMRLTTPQEVVQADLDAALNYLQDLPDVDPARTASMGFCFGGGESLQLGLRQSERLAVTIMYYGAVVTNPELLRPFTDGQAVLGIFGEEDQQIFVDEVLEFEAALNSLDIENQVTIYAGVGHAFLTEENYDEPGAAGDAWQETLTFLEENLK